MSGSFCCRIIYRILRSTRDHVSPRALRVQAGTRNDFLAVGWHRSSVPARYSAPTGRLLLRERRGARVFCAFLGYVRVGRCPLSRGYQRYASTADRLLVRRKSTISYPRSNNSAVRTRNKTIRERNYRQLIYGGEASSSYRAETMAHPRRARYIVDNTLPVCISRARTPSSRISIRASLRRDIGGLVDSGQLVWSFHRRPASFNRNELDRRSSQREASAIALRIRNASLDRRLTEKREKMNTPVYASSCPALQSNLSLHSSSYYSEYSGAARRRLSSTGEADTSATSSYEGSDSSENSDESRLEPVSQMERDQLETFFRGLKSQVFVCESLANLYLGNASQTERWELRFTGIPVVVLDLGETRSRSKRRIQILLAERGTCFTLWRETIDNLSSYKVSGPAFHTMCLSSDHTRLAGLSFDNPKAANDLWQHIERLVSCPENISLSVPGKKKKKPVQKKVVLPAKSNISQPCQFQHVTSVDAADRSRYFSLQTLVPALNELGNSLEANF